MIRAGLEEQSPLGKPPRDKSRGSGQSPACSNLQKAKRKPQPRFCVMVVLQHFHDRDRCFLFDFPVMVIVSRFTRICKNGIWIITGTETIPCPVCGGKLQVHGTCLRCVRDEQDRRQCLRLRVLSCKECGHTHRELPEGLVPYKRHSAESICAMKERPETCFTEPSVRQKILAWLSWFLCYADQVTESLRAQGFRLPNFSGYELCRQLKQFVRLVGNAGMWEQHRSAMTLP